MSDEAFESRLAALCRDAFGEGELQRLARLSGGANMESWALDWGTERLVLRRLPGGGGSEAPAEGNLGAISLDLFSVLLGGATAMLPVYARDVPHVGVEGLGPLRAAPSAGAVLGAACLAVRSFARNGGAASCSRVTVLGMAES